MTRTEEDFMAGSDPQFAKTATNFPSSDNSNSHTVLRGISISADVDFGQIFASSQYSFGSVPIAFAYGENTNGGNWKRFILAFLSKAAQAYRPRPVTSLTITTITTITKIT